VDQIQHQLQDASECHIEDISKGQAVRLLAPQILAMQSKGYNLVAIAAMLADKGIALTAPAPKSYLNLAKEVTCLWRRKPPRSTRGSVPDLPADRSRPVTSIETEALYKPDALPKRTDSKNAAAATAAPNPITFCITTDSATGAGHARRSTRARRVAAPIGVCPVEGIRGYLRTKPPDSTGDNSLLFPALTSKRNTTLGGPRFRLTARTGPEAQPQHATQPPVFCRRIGRGNQPKPVRSRSMFTDQ
jgi:hypothetical protein